MFSNRLKELRESKGLSQKDLAQAFGLSQSTVGNWESGSREPNFKTIKELADFFDVSTDFLLGIANEPKSLDEQLEGINFALWGEVQDLTDGQKRDVINFVQFIKSRKPR